MDVGDRVVIRVGCSDGVVESSGRGEAVDREAPRIEATLGVWGPDIFVAALRCVGRCIRDE